MDVTLTPALDAFVEERFRTGLYDSKSEVVREALRLLHGHYQAGGRALVQPTMLVAAAQSPAAVIQSAAPAAAPAPAAPVAQAPAASGPQVSVSVQPAEPRRQVVTQGEATVVVETISPRLRTQLPTQPDPLPTPAAAAGPSIVPPHGAGPATPVAPVHVTISRPQPPLDPQDPGMMDPPPPAALRSIVQEIEEAIGKQSR